MNEDFTFLERSKKYPYQQMPTTYGGIFYPPYLDSTKFDIQKGETCLVSSFRVAINSQGVQKAYDVPLQSSDRMRHIFHAHGLENVETMGVLTDQIFDLVNHFPKLKEDIKIKKMFWEETDLDNKKRWLKELIDGNSIISIMNAKKFYPEEKDIDDSERHAVALLGISIPSIEERQYKNASIFVYDPNFKEPKWIEDASLFSSLAKNEPSLCISRQPNH